MTHIRDLFLLDPEVVFLNHGSFGATPRPVFDAYQEWQVKLENQPVQFFASNLYNYLEHARQILATYLGTDRDNLVYIPNATYGVNVIARSLPLSIGDEILTSDHEYGACTNAWTFASHKNGTSFIRQAVPLPIFSKEELIENIWSGVTTRTKLIFISHITSPTAIRFPVEEICKRARQNGILTFIDGAHAPGQIDLDLDKIGADFYTGNCHKWMLAPKGSAFLYVRPELQELIDPLVISWGWGENSDFSTGSQYLDYFQWWGTHDPSAFLSVPAAIDFQKEYDWLRTRAACHTLATQTRKQIDELTGLETVCPDSTDWFNQMFISSLPNQIGDTMTFKKMLYDEYKIEVPIIDWNEYKFIRVSLQGYNSSDDTASLLNALEFLLHKIKHIKS